MEILFEDNHLIALNKSSHDLVQGDKTGDISLDGRLKDYLKKKYYKPGNVFVGQEWYCLPGRQKHSAV